MKKLVEEWLSKWRAPSPKEEAREWRMAAKTPSFGMFDVYGHPRSEDPAVREAREEMERQNQTATEAADRQFRALLAAGIPESSLGAYQRQRPRVSVPDQSTIDRVGELARQFVAQGLTIETPRASWTQEMLGRFPEQDIETQPELDRLPITDQLNIREVEEMEWEIVARTTTARSKKRKTTTGSAKVGGPTTKNDPIFVWGMQSSKPRNGGHFITYEVRLNDDASVSCNCPGWIFKKKTDDRGCKHTRHPEVVANAQDFFERHQRGEQLPTIDPPAGQAASVTTAPRPPTAKDQMQGFGRLIILDD